MPMEILRLQKQKSVRFCQTKRANCVCYQTQNLIMKTYVILFCLVLLPSSGLAQTVDNFELKDLQNNLQEFEELKGENLTLIDFWASWCKPCKKAIPYLNDIYANYKEKGVEIIGINCDGPRSISKVIPLSKSLRIQYPVLLDIDAAVKNDLNIMLFPTLIMVDASGNIVWTHEGFVSGDDEHIKKAIDQQLNVL